MSRRPLPEPSSGFRPGDLLRLALAISFMVLIILAIVRFRNPATWQWVRNVPSENTTPLSVGETNLPSTESETGSQASSGPSDVKPVVETYELGQLGLAIAGSTAPLTGGLASERLTVSLLSLEALAYATPIPGAPTPIPPAKPSRLRYVLPPDMELLRGARDREGFLVEPAEAADNPFFRRERLDADARYHLIALVLEQARAGGEGFLNNLHRDALWDVPYELLRDKPQRYRGEVIGVRGTLVWIKRFALERGGRDDLPEYIYQGVLEQDGLRTRPVWLLFTHVPSNMPPEKNWLGLFATDTSFVGYYLKVVEIESPPEPPRTRQTAKPRPARLYFPVLVGYTVELPPPPPGQDWSVLLMTALAIIGGIVLVSAVALYLYYRSERPYLQKMAQVRARVAQRGEVVEQEQPSEASSFRLENWNGSPSTTSASEETPPSSGDAPPSSPSQS